MKRRSSRKRTEGGGDTVLRASRDTNAGEACGERKDKGSGKREEERDGTTGAGRRRGTEGKRGRGPLCEKNRGRGAPRACTAFPEGEFRSWHGAAWRGAAPGLSVKKKRMKGGEGAGRGERRKEETQGEAAVVHVSDYRTALACSNERKSICMIHARESVPKGVDGGGGRGEQDAFARGERKRESERAREGRKKVVRPRERTVRPGAGGSEQRTSLPSTTGFSKRTGDEPPGVTT